MNAFLLPFWSLWRAIWRIYLFLLSIISSPASLPGGDLPPLLFHIMPKGSFWLINHYLLKLVFASSPVVQAIFSASVGYLIEWFWNHLSEKSHKHVKREQEWMPGYLLNLLYISIHSSVGLKNVTVRPSPQPRSCFYYYTYWQLVFSSSTLSDS